MTNEQLEYERQLFEAWICTYEDDAKMKAKFLAKDANGNYHVMQAYQAWNTWQARAAIVYQGDLK